MGLVNRIPPPLNVKGWPIFGKNITKVGSTLTYLRRTIPCSFFDVITWIITSCASFWSSYTILKKLYANSWYLPFVFYYYALYRNYNNDNLVQFFDEYFNAILDNNCKYFCKLIFNKTSLQMLNCRSLYLEGAWPFWTLLGVDRAEPKFTLKTSLSIKIELKSDHQFFLYLDNKKYLLNQKSVKLYSKFSSKSLACIIVQSTPILCPLCPFWILQMINMNWWISQPWIKIWFSNIIICHIFAEINDIYNEILFWCLFNRHSSESNYIIST